MKIKISDFGPISFFEFDLAKDFNVIFGKNNIGKSYAITAIYLIVKTFENLVASEVDIFRQNFFLGTTVLIDRSIPFFKLIDNYEKEIIETLKHHKVKGVLQIEDKLEELLSIMIAETILPSLEKSFINSYASIEALSNQLSKKTFVICVSLEDFEFSISGNKSHLFVSNVTFFKPICIKPANIYKQLNETEERITLYHNQKNDNSHIYDDIITVFGRFYSTFRTTMVNDIYFLPASRSGLYQALSAFSAVIAELSKSRYSLTTHITLPNLSEPVSDYFLTLSNISPKKNNAFSEIVEEIEQQILKGQISFNQDTKKMVFTPTTIEIPLDLAYTSSMISEIAPIVAYLKYIMSEREDDVIRYSFLKKERDDGKMYSILFIEEPEAHLHPEIQVKLLEIFCKLSKLNVKVVMTSHSNYMFNKLSNLILDGQLDYEKVGSYLMKSGEFGSVIDSISMRADADGIQDENFADVAEMLYEERINIYTRLNNQAHAH